MSTQIIVIGMGYVGIPMAALLADVDDFYVTGIQRRSQRSGWKIDWLNQGKNPFEGEEPGLDELIAKVVREGKFKVTDKYDDDFGCGTLFSCKANSAETSIDFVSGERILGEGRGEYFYNTKDGKYYRRCELINKNGDCKDFEKK